MLSIFKKKSTERPDLSGLECDMHSHLLPGIDDGSPDAATSVALMRGLIDLGYQRLITTPHVLWDIYKNDESTMRPAYNDLRDAMRARDVETPVRFAAEYFLDYHIDELIEEEIALMPIKDNQVLVEFSFVSAPLDLKEKLFSLQMAGYQPVLAHPERYTYFLQDTTTYDELKGAGYLFQLNLLSLTGYYGKAPLELAQHLLRNNYIEYLGTDLHHARHLHALQSHPELTDVVKQLQDSGKLLNPSL